MGRRVTFARGSGWVRFFYEGDRFTRDRAMPRSVKHSLQDEGSVQTLAGDEHRIRKALFIDVLDASARIDLDRHVAEAWQKEWAAASGNRCRRRSKMRPIRRLVFQQSSQRGVILGG